MLSLHTVTGLAKESTPTRLNGDTGRQKVDVKSTRHNDNLPQEWEGVYEGQERHQK